MISSFKFGRRRFDYGVSVLNRCVWLSSGSLWVCLTYKRKGCFHLTIRDDVNGKVSFDSDIKY